MADNPQDSATRLCGTALEIDHALAAMDRDIDWLTRLTPINIDAIWDGFQASGFRTMPDSKFGEGLEQDAAGLRRQLFELPVDDIGNDLVKALMLEKQRELDRQIELVRMRDKDGFILASLDLFGSVGEQLFQTALDLLEEVPDLPREPDDAGAGDLCNFARREIADYREREPGFSCEVTIDPTSGTSLYVSMGDLHVAHDFTTSRHRIGPLVAHEVGTHSVTRYNGQKQPLLTLAGGLSDYDVLQEGLAVFAEYLTGYLPADRLRLLAARVIAAHMAVEEKMGPEIYACLVEEYGLRSKEAFDTAVRAKRGGGMTKDALYLKGLAELLAYLAHDHDLDILFLGKFALKQLPSLKKLIEQGVLHPPQLLPNFCHDPAALERLEAARSLPLASLYQETPQK